MRAQTFFNARESGAAHRDPDDLKPDANYDDRRPAEQMSGAPPPGRTSARSFAPTTPRRRSFESAAPPRSRPPRSSSAIPFESTHFFRSSPRGAPRDARVAGTPLRGPSPRPQEKGANGKRIIEPCACARFADRLG